MNLISLFRRSTSHNSFVPEIDGLRFFTIFCIMVFHLSTAMHRNDAVNDQYWHQLTQSPQITDFTWWFIRLQLSVKVFFSISGYILAIPFLKHYFYEGKKVDIQQYYIRRITRIEPPFVVSLIVFSIIHFALLKNPLGYVFKHFLAGLFYAHYPVYGTPNPINPVTWTLETEAQFYITLPFIVGLIFYFKQKWSRTLIIVLILTLLFGLRYMIVKYDWANLYNSLFKFFLFFGIGGVFAAFQLAYPQLFPKNKKLWLDLLGIIGLFIMFYFFKPQKSLVNNLLFILGTFILFYSVFTGKILNWIFTRPVIYLIGGMCYTLYLLHYALFHLLIPYTVKFTLHLNYWGDLLIQMLIVFPITLIVGVIFYLLIEKPCMNKDWPKQLMAKLRLRKEHIPH